MAEPKPRHPHEVVGAIREALRLEAFIDGRIPSLRVKVLLDELDASIAALEKRKDAE